MTYGAYESVKAFHIKHGHQTAELPSRMSRAVRLLRSRLITEELGELVSALHEWSVCNPTDPAKVEKYVLIADAFSDLLYVVIGTAVSQGTPVKNPWSWYAKGAGEIIDSLELVQMFTGHVAGLVALMTCDAKPSVIQSAIENFSAQINAWADRMLIPLADCFAEVHRSNMTKRTNAERINANAKYSGGLDPKGPGYEPPQLLQFLKG